MSYHYTSLRIANDFFNFLVSVYLSGKVVVSAEVLWAVKLV